MSIWSRITAAVQALAKGEPLAAVFEHLRTPPERSVGFTIAVIALGAKMAKADGRVTRDEVTAFRQVFDIPPGEEAHAARLFNLARQDVAGFEDYARRVRRMFGEGDPVLVDLLEGLFYIAVADGQYHPGEDGFLARVAEIFGVSEPCFKAMRARLVPDVDPDPYAILGVTQGTPMEDMRAAWRQLVKENHPDRMIARGVPLEAVRLAEARLAAVNRAWDEISSHKVA